MPNYALRKELNPLSKTAVIAIHERYHKQVNARGQDLLEIGVHTTDNEEALYTVGFSHRTIKDFLTKPAVTRTLQSWASDEFDADVSLCKATLAVVKSLSSSARTFHQQSAFLTNSPDQRMDVANDPIESGNVYNSPDVERWCKHVKDFFIYASRIEDEGRKVDETIVDELRHVITSFHRPDKTDLDFSSAIPYQVLDTWVHRVHRSDMMPLDPLSLALASQ